MQNTLISTHPINKEFDAVVEQTSLKSYLKASAYSSGERSPLEKRMNDDIYYNYIYAGSNEAEDYKKDILDRIEKDNARNIVLSGYKGCGKTTFVHYLIRTLNSRHLLLNFDDIVDYGSEIKTVLVMHAYNAISEDILDGNCEITSMFLSIFYSSENLSQLSKHYDIDNRFMWLFHKLDWAKILIHDKKDYDAAIVYLRNDIKLYLNDYDISRLMIFIVMWDTALRIKRNISSKCFIIFDNLDTIYNTASLPKFVQQIALFRNNIDRIFSRLTYNGISIGDPSQDYYCIFVMRETTKAEFTDHFQDQKVSLYIPKKSMSFIYDIRSIIRRRREYLEFIKAHNPSSFGDHCSQLLIQIQRMEEMMDDPYVRNDILGLFNHDYRTSFEVLAELNYNDNSFYESCTKLKQLVSNSSWNRYGSRCLLFREIYNLLGDSGFFAHLKKSEFLIQNNNRNYAANLDRLILLYLNNSQNKHSSDELKEQEFVELNVLFKEFFRFCNNHRAIANSIWDMYEMRTNPLWNHLVTFDEMRDVTKDGLTRQMVCAENDENIKYGKIRITTAGRTYLELMLPHFEYYAARVFGNRKPSLFSLTPVDLVNTSKLIHYIKEVRNEITSCCTRLSAFHETVFSNISDYSGAKFLESKLAWQKPTDFGNTVTMYHCERIVHANIGYLDSLRMYSFYRIDELLNNVSLPKGTDISGIIFSLNKPVFSKIQLDANLRRTDNVRYIISDHSEDGDLIIQCLSDSDTLYSRIPLAVFVNYSKMVINQLIINQIHQYIWMFGLSGNRKGSALYSENTVFLVSCYECCISEISNSGFTNFSAPIDRRHGEPLLMKLRKEGKIIPPTNPSDVESSGINNLTENH